MDLGVIFVEDGVVRKIGDYFSNSYDIPARDNIQDWKLDRRNTLTAGNRVEIHFSRKIETSDTEKVSNLF